jgi:hypothetical protein
VPRSNRPRRPGPRRPEEELSPRSVSPTRRESDADGDWLVRPVPGAAALKPYRCPGCDQVIPVGLAHLVCWPDDGSVTERRHWHTPCWQARFRRRPGRRR